MSTTMPAATSSYPSTATTTTTSSSFSSSSASLAPTLPSTHHHDHDHRARSRSLGPQPRQPAQRRNAKRVNDPTDPFFALPAVSKSAHTTPATSPFDEKNDRTGFLGADSSAGGPTGTTTTMTTPPTGPAGSSAGDAEEAGMLERYLTAPLMFVSFLLSLFWTNRQHRAWRVQQHGGRGAATAEAAEEKGGGIAAWLPDPVAWIDPEPYREVDGTAERGTKDGRGGGRHWYMRKMHRKVARMEIGEALELRTRVVVALVLLMGVAMLGGAWVALRIWRTVLRGIW